MRQATKSTRLSMQRVIVGTRTLTGCHEPLLLALETGSGATNVVLSTGVVVTALSLGVAPVDVLIEVKEAISKDAPVVVGRATKVVRPGPTILVVAGSEGESMVIVSDPVLVTVRAPPAFGTVLKL
jgi:hypothetical protein